jgi:hypothetical protein
MKELWTGQVHLLTPPMDFGDTKCLTNVVAWADDEEDFVATVTVVFARRNWSIVEVSHCQRAADFAAKNAELSQQIAEAKRQPGSCIFGTLHYYRSRLA